MASQQSLASTLPKDLPATFMKEITNDFSPDQELGRSIFGTVYKVRLTPNI
jgi:disease resistance protein RPM1